MAPTKGASARNGTIAGFDVKMASAEGSLKELEKLEDSCYEADRSQRIQSACDKVCTAVDSALESLRGRGSVPDTQARAAFLKGRALLLVEGREAQAEELLSRALRLDPNMLAAWNALGEVYWNLQNYKRSRECFEQATLTCGENPVSLRSLSMVLRALDVGDGFDAIAKRTENYAQALNMAKRAVGLDATDPQNWETLGNAYFGEFFVSGKLPDNLGRAMIAYERAEMACNKIGKLSLSLQLNRGKAAKYVENYELALQCFAKARELGSASAVEEQRRVRELLERVGGCVKGRGNLKAKRVHEIVAGLGNHGEHKTFSDVRAETGKEGSPLVARVVSVIDRNDDMPVILVCCDPRGEFFALSMYGAQQSMVADAVVPLKSGIQIRQCHLRNVSCASASGDCFIYPCVWVAHPRDVTVIGSGSLAATAVPSQFTAGAARTESKTQETQQESALVEPQAPVQARRASDSTAGEEEDWKIDPEIEKWIRIEEAQKRKAERRKLKAERRKLQEFATPAEEHTDEGCAESNEGKSGSGDGAETQTSSLNSPRGGNETSQQAAKLRWSELSDSDPDDWPLSLRSSEAVAS